jgi:hypothetical protein
VQLLDLIEGAPDVFGIFFHIYSSAGSITGLIDGILAPKPV